MRRRCWVGIYAARPSSQGDCLDVNSKHLVIDFKQNEAFFTVYRSYALGSPAYIFQYI